MLESFVGFTFSPTNSRLVVEQSAPTVPFRFAANPFRDTGVPYGHVVIDGKSSVTAPDGLPLLVVHRDGTASVRTDIDPVTLARARYAFSGSALLVREGKPVPITSAVNTINSRIGAITHRIGIGVLQSGEILVVSRACSAVGLQDLLLSLGAQDAIMGATDDIFIDYPMGGLKMGERPMTIVEAMAVKPLRSPVVVIDAGHGGSDAGAVANGVREKDINLNVSRAMAKYLSEKYEGTFVLIRDSDVRVELADRSTKSNKLGADFFLSIHANAATTPEANGFETFVFPTTSPENTSLRKVFHEDVMKYLAPLGVKDRGMKAQNFSVLRLTKCPAMLIELMFVSNPKDARMLADKAFMDTFSKVLAEAYAKALGLKKKASVTQPVDTKLWRVQVGAFTSRESAEQLSAKLQALGYTTTLKHE